MRLEFSFDDGGQNDVTIAYLLTKYGFRGTFYIPTNCELPDPVIQNIAQDHEIGGHTVNHPQDLKELSDGQLEHQIENNRAYLKFLTGQDINKFCYPRGRYDERVIKAVKKAGFISARTTQILETEVPKDPFKYGTTIHCTYPRTEYVGKNWLDVAKSLFQLAKDRGEQGYFHLWGHSEEIARYKDWDNFEKLLIYIKENE